MISTMETATKTPTAKSAALTQSTRHTTQKAVFTMGLTLSSPLWAASVSSINVLPE